MRNSYIFIQENAFENVVCEMASTLLGLIVLSDSFPANSCRDCSIGNGHPTTKQVTTQCNYTKTKQS